MGLRVCIGIGEAFVQAAPLYLTLWYKRNELASRTAVVFSTSAVAGAFNGLISYGIQKNMDNARGVATWKWIFIIEGRGYKRMGAPEHSTNSSLTGAVSIAYGFVIFALLPPVPEKLKWGFTAEQKGIAIRRSREAYNIIDAKINPRQLVALLKDPKIYFYGACTPLLFCGTNFLSCSLYVCKRQFDVLRGLPSYRAQNAQLFESRDTAHASPNICMCCYLQHHNMRCLRSSEGSWPISRIIICCRRCWLACSSSRQVIQAVFWRNLPNWYWDIPVRNIGVILGKQ